MAKHPRKQADQIERVRRIALVSVTAFVILVLGYLTLYALGLAPGLGGSAGVKPYFDLQRPIESEPLEVVEFFSFDCIHCRRLDPLIERWKRTLPEGVAFRRVHVAYAPPQRYLARAHETLVHLGVDDLSRERVFRAIHDRNRQFTSIEDVAEFVAGNGVTADRFVSLSQGKRIGGIVESNMELVRQLGVDRIPALLVGNRYLILVGLDRDAVLSDMDILIADILAGREPDLAAMGAGSLESEKTEEPPSEDSDPNS